MVKPTKLTELPWIEPISKRGTLIFPTDQGLMDKNQLGAALGERPWSIYERYRRCGAGASLAQVNLKLFKGEL